MFVRVYILLL